MASNCRTDPIRRLESSKTFAMFAAFYFMFNGSACSDAHFSVDWMSQNISFFKLCYDFTIVALLDVMRNDQISRSSVLNVRNATPRLQVLFLETETCHRFFILERSISLIEEIVLSCINSVRVSLMC